MYPGGHEGINLILSRQGDSEFVLSAQLYEYQYFVPILDILISDISLVFHFQTLLNLHLLTTPLCTTDVTSEGAIPCIAGFWDTSVLGVSVVQGPKQAIWHVKAGGSWKEKI